MHINRIRIGAEAIVTGTSLFFSNIKKGPYNN
jgi:hypothetical protein